MKEDFKGTRAIWQIYLTMQFKGAAETCGIHPGNTELERQDTGYQLGVVDSNLEWAHIVTEWVPIPLLL